MRKQNGITLIALVITIIVLLILAGVAIAMLSGQNGVMNRASEARYENVLASVNEQVKLAALSLKTSITANMVGNSGYLATGSAAGRYDADGKKAGASTADTVFGNLVKEVANGISATTTFKTEGYNVMGYIDTQGTESVDGYGFIYITYTDNSLRSSLPTRSTDANYVVGKNPWLSSGVKYNATAINDPKYANQAIVAYVIEVTNYDCSLLGSTSKGTTVDAVLTTTDAVNKASTGDYLQSSYNATSISSILKTTKPVSSGN